MTDESVEPLAADNTLLDPSRPSRATLDAAAGKPAPQAAPEPAQASAPTAKDATSYVLLVLSESTGEWMVTNDSVTAKSAEAAIRLHAENTTPGSPDGTYIAVPARSWRPITIQTKTTTTLVFGEPS